jgi:hypothetical protein
MSRLRKPFLGSKLGRGGGGQPGEETTVSRLRKLFLVAGCALILAFGALLGYACYREEELRKQFNAPVEMNYGFIPLDLLQGRTEFEGRDQKQNLHRLRSGRAGEERVLMARVACGVGALGLILLVFRRYAMKES